MPSSLQNAPGLVPEIDKSGPGPGGAMFGDIGLPIILPTLLGAQGTGSGGGPDPAGAYCARAALCWPTTTAASATPIHHFAMFASPNITSACGSFADWRSLRGP